MDALVKILKDLKMLYHSKVMWSVTENHPHIHNDPVVNWEATWKQAYIVKTTNKQNNISIGLKLC